MIYKILLIAGVASNVVAQVMLKSGMKGLDLIQSSAGTNEKLRAVILNKFVWGGLAFYGLGFVLYSIVLSKIELSKAYPVASVASIVLITVISIVFLTETLNFQKVVGITFALIGIMILLYR
ncbi:MAG TPA: SMR family transporter [Spirochaetota bacterium]|nr:SMR family transporter [Spirochaetota bacterium]HNT11675.1 SMR family transporter [Spirochaetota bacterium]